MELFEPALADFRSFLGFGSDGMNVRWEQAKAFSRLGRWEEALAAIEAAERLQPKEALNLSRKGTVLLWAGRMPESVAAFTRGVDLDPSSALALQEKAYGAAYAGVPCPEVSADLAKSLELDPDEEWVAREVAWIHADVFARDCPAEFRPDLALELARRVVAGDATVPEFHETLGLVLYRRGSYEEARRALLEAVRLYSQPSASTLFTLAMTCQRLGRAAEARSFNDQAASRMQATYPNDPRLVRAMREASIVVDAR
jgi:tetratricopeptide (TPR) repeat protein